MSSVAPLPVSSAVSGRMPALTSIKATSFSPLASVTVRDQFGAPLPDAVVAKLREVTKDVLAEAVAKDPLVKKVHESYMSFKAIYDKWAGYSEAVYHAKIRV